MRAGGPAKDSLGNLYFGVHYGVVVQNKDPDNLDRIKVRFPWIDKGDQDQSHWAQLLTPMEGNKFGWYTLPDIDDVVAVMFVAGEMSQPVVLGGIWSKVDVSPEPNEDGKNNFRGYRSRSGHRLILDDTAKTKVVLADKAEAYPGQLSGGQQQRAAIARALCINPRVMLFDEPTSALDPELEVEVLRVIKLLADEGRTMILVTHDMEFARSVGDRAIFLHAGKVEEEGPVDQVFGATKSARLKQFLSAASHA